MEKSIKIKMPSGAELEIRLAQFALSWDLYQEISKTGDDSISLLKVVANKEIENAIRRCMIVCQYNKLKIVDDTWEPEEARQDYIMALFEVAKANITPFVKALISKSSQSTETVTSIPL